jgi:hypothetical protein
MKPIPPLLAAALVLAACSREETAPTPQPAEQAQASEATVNTIAPPAAPAAPAAQPTSTPTPAPEAPASDNWRDYANAEDEGRIARLDAAWAKAVESVNKGRHETEFANLGPLSDPKVSLPRPHPAPGVYRCRTIKLGHRMGMIAYDWFKCRIELTPGGDLVFSKLTGSQRSFGKLYPGEGNRLVFIGTQAWGNRPEDTAPAYGQDPLRDQVGVWERIGDQRWRLALPWPRVESDLDLVELAK